MTDPAKIAITNVRVFDGHQLTAPTTVVIDGTTIGSDATGATMVDGGGGTLLPGLIDAHIHLNDQQTLRELLNWGVTTGLDMNTNPPELVTSLRNVPGLTDIRSSGTLAAPPGSSQAKMPGFPQHALISKPEQAGQFVADRLAEGSDYIKIIAEKPANGGFSQGTLDALVRAAHTRDTLTVVHAANAEAFDMAQASGSDVVTHVPIDRPASARSVAAMVTDGQLSVPTLVMMQGTAEGLARRGITADYQHARDSVTALYAAGVPVLAGTDAHGAYGPAAVFHGESIHSELELLVDAGLTPTDALRAATVLPAQYFGLTDRGTIAPGLRADLLLIQADPIQDITNTRKIDRVWCGGREHRHVGPAAVNQA